MLMYIYRDEIYKLVTALKEYDAQHDTFTYAYELAALESEEQTTTVASTAHQRHLSATARAADVDWLASKFDKFEPLAYWTPGYLIAMRLLQTSAMVFITNPSLQAAVASLIAFVGIALQTNTMPYRRPSE